MTITDLTETVMKVIGFEGKTVFEQTKPDGTPRKLLSVDRLEALGWHPRTSLTDGIKKTYADFRANMAG